jgi:CubicO group peptidase (beta-lactamase class C family)
MIRKLACGLMGAALLLPAAEMTLRDGAPEAAGLHPGRLGSVLSRVQEWIDADIMAGAGVLIARNGVVATHRAYGWADVEKQVRFAPDTICQLASVTKPVTATAVMLLVDAGKIGLDDPVAKYIPAFRRHPGVTIRHLLTHTSGLPRDVPSRKVPPAMHHTWLSRRLADVADEAAGMDLEFQPGSRYSYCNAGIATLGRVVEVVSGQPFDQFVKTRLLDPLGMTAATFQPPAAVAGRVAVLYDDRSGSRAVGYRYDPAFRITNPAPNGGLFATTRDMAAFVQMFLNGGRYNGEQILSAAGVKQMLADQTAHLPQVRGLGWALHGEGMPRPVAETIFSHSGSSGTYLWGDPRRAAVGALFSQTAGPRIAEIHREFLARVTAAIDPPKATANPQWPRHVVAAGYPTMTAVAADFTGDGLPDVVTNGRRQTYLYAAPDWKETVLHAGPLDAIHSEVMDVDGDGDPDYIGARYSPGLIFWLERPARPLSDPWTYHLVDDQVNGIHGVMGGDIDGDQKPDLAATSAQPSGPFPESLAWFKVPAQARRAERWQRHVFAQKDAPGLSHYVGIGDVNGDGRPDIASAAKVARGGNWFAWWEAPKDPTQVWTKHLIAAKQEGATNILMADVNRDGRMDFVGSRGHGKGVVWFEAPDWKPHDIDAGLTGPHSLAVGDIDRDGDLDVATCAKHDFVAAWFENDGKGSFKTHLVYNDQAAYDVRLVDMDRDRDLDLLIAGQESRNVVWYENRVATR